MSNRKSESTRVVVPISVGAPVESVFALASPVEEYLWIPRWKCQLVHCPRDRVELGTVFREVFSAPFLTGTHNAVTTWTVVAYSPESTRIHFELENQDSVTLYAIELHADGPARTQGTLTLTYRPLSRRGRKLAAGDLTAKLRLMLNVLATMIKHYAETGRMVSSGAILALVRAEPSLSGRDKMNLLLNRMAVSLMRDRDRDRLLEALRRRAA